MNSRERVKKAIHFQGPDAVPHYLPDGKPNDLFWGIDSFHRAADQQPWTRDGEIERRIDGWGVVWERSITDSGKGQAKLHPIQDITRQAEYVFPDCNNLANFEPLKAEIAKNNASDNPKYVLGVAAFSSLNEGTHNIRGLQNMFMDYFANPDDLKGLITRLAEKQEESIRILADLGCDGVMVYDDWGLQSSLMVGPRPMEEVFMPHYRKNWGLARELGMDVWMHSCGYIIEMLEAFADAGLTVVQMDQQENMGLENLAKAAGGKLAFWCPVDIQKTMISGTDQDIVEYVRKMIATLGGFHGGLVSMAYTTPKDIHHTPERIAIMCEAFRKYGVYK